MALNMTGVFSTNVEQIGHDPETNELVVRWLSGKTSVYEGVPAAKAREVINSWSVGKALNAEIVPHFAHRYAK